MEENNGKLPARLYFAIVLQLLPAILGGVYIGYERSFCLGLVVALILAWRPVSKYWTIFLGRTADDPIRRELESIWHKFVIFLREGLLLLVFAGLIILFNNLSEFTDLINSRGTLSVIVSASIFAGLFVFYVYSRWIIIDSTIGGSALFVFFLSIVTVLAIVIVFAKGYTDGGIVNTNIAEDKPGRVMKLSTEEFNWLLGKPDELSVDSDTKRQLDQKFKSFVYFSVVTFTTLGYGDFQPSDESRLLASVEAVFGLVFMAFLVAVWFKLLQDASKEKRNTGITLLDVLQFASKMFGYGLLILIFVSHIPI